MALDHGADLAVEETVGEGDEEALEGQQDIADDDEDGGQG